MRIEFPDYDNCCVNITCSIQKHFGIQPRHKTLGIVDKELEKNYKNIVILLLDGLGQKILQEVLPKNSFLRKNFAQELSAVYPSSTVPATVSIKTGLSPVEHAWWGHFLYFKNLGQTVNVYTNTDMFSKKKVSKDDVAHYNIPYLCFLDQVSERNPDVHAYTVCPANARDNFSTSQVTCNNLTDMSEYIATLCNLDGRRLIYGYLDSPDSVMHKFGYDSPEVSKLLNDINYQVEDLCQKCPNTLFLITADHGQIINKEVRDLTLYPDFLDTLYMMPTGCSRAMSFVVKSHKHKEFRKLFTKYFDDKFILFTKEQVLKNNLLGTGTCHDQLDNLLGDYLVCATDDCSLVYSTIYGSARPEPKGIHGGLTLPEMRVPLIIYGDKVNEKKESY